MIPTVHVSSLLDLDGELATELLATVKIVAGQAIEQHCGCQMLTTLGNEQHNRHLHWHIAVGDGVARFVQRGPQSSV